MSKELNKIMGMVCERERMYYNAAKVDALIAEKDKEIAELKEFAEDACIERDDNQTAIDELQAENECLKQKLEDAKATAYAESVDAGMRERRLRRALYKACANWAKCEERINNRDAYEASEYLPSAEDKFRKNAERWSEMETKCRAKAEVYK